MDVRYAGLGLVLALSCSTPAMEPPPPAPTPSNVALKVAPAAKPRRVPFTTEMSIVPLKNRLDEHSYRNPNTPAEVRALSEEGFGDWQRGPGIAMQAMALNDEPIPGKVAEPRLITRFVHLADYQLTDDESIARTPTLDSPGATAGAYRTNEAYGCWTIEAAHRTVNDINETLPIDFALLGGDNVDNAQENEVDWVLGLIAGGEVNCDSGADNDLIGGPNNDPKDPFIAQGLAMPTYWVNGNHDVTLQGNVAVLPFLVAASMGPDAPGGARDYRYEGGPIELRGPFPKDEHRRLLYPSELIERVSKHGNGHGLGEWAVNRAKANYTFDKGELRFVVIDSTAETGGHQGLIRRGDLEDWILPTLDKARDERKLVVISSHHAAGNITLDGGELGIKQEDAITQERWLEALGAYDNIILSVVAHSHLHRLRRLSTPQGGHLFELMTASLMDFPGQFRLIEIFAEGASWLRVSAVAVDFMDYGIDMIQRGRELMVLDFTSGFGLDGRAAVGETNVELWIPRPRW